jgi:hypothetical protein
VPLSELPEKINSGFRILDTLKPAPNCAHNPGIAPYPPQWPGEYISQPESLNFKAVENTDHQQNQFMPINAGGMDELNQPSNYYLYRQQRQRPFRSQQGGQYNYAQVMYPAPIPHYAQPIIPQNQSYPQGSYPIAPYPPGWMYPLPDISSTVWTTTESISTSTHRSNAHSFAVPISVIFGSLSLLLALCLIN